MLSSVILNVDLSFIYLSLSSFYCVLCMYYNITMLLKQTLVHGMHVIQVGMNALFVDGLRGVSLLILRVFVGGKVVLLLLR